MLRALVWEEQVSQRCEAREAVAYYSAREEGTGGAGTLGEESLQRSYVPPSRDWCVPHQHSHRQIPLQGHLSMWPCSCCKTTTPIMLGQVGMMGAVIWQQLQSHTGCAKLLSPYKSVAQSVALQQQIS